MKKRETIDPSILSENDTITYWKNGYRTGEIDEINTKKQFVYIKPAKIIEKYSGKPKRRVKVKFCEILRKEG